MSNDKLRSTNSNRTHSKHTKKNKSAGKRIFKIILKLILLLILVIVGYSTYCIVSAPKIDTDKIYSILNQSSIIYTAKDPSRPCSPSNKKKVDTIYAGANRRNINYDKMPQDLINAYVALEDKTFWDHHGFNYIRIIGAVKEAVLSRGNISGTSTITQQLARNVFLQETMSSHSMKRKIIEAWYTKKLEHKLSKEQIIEAYLNTISLGFNSNGVEAASEAYFSKNVDELNLSQYATLAALPQAPTKYAPVQLVPNDAVSTDSKNILKRTDAGTYIMDETCIPRRNLCLKLMLDQGYISEEEYNAAINRPLSKDLKPNYTAGRSKSSYFTDYLIGELIKDFQNQYNISYQEAWEKVYKGGLKIYSTMDYQAQNVVEKEFNNDANFPNPVNIRYDSLGNILSSHGEVILYNYKNYFNEQGLFNLQIGEYEETPDGGLILNKGSRLRFYRTTPNGKTDYSVEFPKLFTMQNGKLYSISGGYVNIPRKAKKLDANGNIEISSEFMNSKEGHEIFLKNNLGTYSISTKGYTLNQKTIQPQAAMTIVDNKTGHIKAMAGGRNSSGRLLYNRAVNFRQPGSSMKPLGVYAPAIQQSAEQAQSGQPHKFINAGIDNQGARGWGKYITAGSIVVDEKTTNNGLTWPQNAGGIGYSGKQTLRTALKNSINTCAYKIFMQVGAPYSSNMVQKFGITSLVTSGPTNDMNASALALGGMTKGVSTLDMANAYTTFANNGKRASKPICYTKVKDSEGKTVLKNTEDNKTEVLDPGVAWIMKDLLQGVVNGGTGTRAAISGVTVGGKTGTTSDQYDIWFDGFTPNYSAALWIGNDVNIQLSGMGSNAAALWGQIMSQIPNAKTGSYPAMPSNVSNIGGEYYINGTYGGVSTEGLENLGKEEETEKVEEENKDSEDVEDNNKNDQNPNETPDSGNNGNTPVNPDPSKPSTPDNPTPSNPSKPSTPDNPTPPNPENNNKRK